MVLRVLGVIMLVSFAVFRIWPEIDLGVSAIFISDGEWFGKQGFLWTLRNLYFKFAYIVLAWALVVWVISLLGKLSAPRKIYHFILSFFALGPLLIVNGIFKAFWGRARPQNVTEFGGSLDFTPVTLLPVDQCAHDCSFVSGEGAAAFTLIILIFLLTKRWPWGAALLMPMAIMRIMAGGHFLSDVIFAGLMIAVVCVVLMRAFGLSLADTRASGQAVWNDSFGWIKRFDNAGNPRAN